jgi:hypothetical protein
MDHRPVPALVLQGLAFALTIAVALVVLFIPLYTTQTSAGGPEMPDGPMTAAGHLASLAVNGQAVFVPPLIPVVLTGLPLLVWGKPWRGLSITATILLAAVAAAASASVGWFYLPALTVSVAALLAPPAGRPPAAS